MILDIFWGTLLPLIGTAAGSAFVFVMAKKNVLSYDGCLSGFAGGVMLAASVWSLIIPAIERSTHLAVFSFVPALCGIWIGFVFLMLCQKLTLYLQCRHSKELPDRFLFVLAIILHNIPEGMAVGVGFASAIQSSNNLALIAAFMLSVGITLQNIPEGAIISMPLACDGLSKGKAFLYGTLSGIVEPAAALITLAFSGFISSLLPYFLGFAAGAMLFVAAQELLPKAAQDEGSLKGLLFFFIGFSIMMVLDVALG